MIKSRESCLTYVRHIEYCIGVLYGYSIFVTSMGIGHYLFCFQGYHIFVYFQGYKIFGEIIYGAFATLQGILAWFLWDIGNPPIQASTLLRQNVAIYGV